MRRISLALLATLQLSHARYTGFSIHEDLLAYPQYEVVFADTFISEHDAQALLKNNPPHPTYSADFDHPTYTETSEADTGNGKDGAPSDAYAEAEHTYEVISMAPYRYLCSIPNVQPPEPENKTAHELAKAEEARELSRAAANGWDLLSELQDSCLYFVSGWWSYSFCNNQKIVQFHAMAAAAQGQPPRRDPHTAEYVLGRVPMLPATTNQHTSRDGDAPLPAELQVKGDKRYLVQKLEGGTVCDLTGRERTIEVQYHCVPGLKSARIGWIKEVITCVYVMVINTPRLCNDVAFLPPEETKANPITCQLISDSSFVAPPLLDQHMLKQAKAADQAQERDTEENPPQDVEAAPKSAPTIGGVVVGARNVLSGADEAGKPPTKLDAPRNIFADFKAIDGKMKEVLAEGASKEDGGKVTAKTREELEKLDLQPEMINEMRERIEELAGELGWKLEIVELPGGEFRELHGYIDEEEITDDQEAFSGGDRPQANGAPEGKAAKTQGNRQDKTQTNDQDRGKAHGKQAGSEEDEKGSEETFFKEEL